ncbi:DUF5018-related domain-containing protein [Chitinophaga caseinilytica]|uniref:DUF5018 domain-containing protein n=1 Tax=Chitinophaga caseinilytica TaxID=2267521 RepID=A0ABZ2Z082_9BACT
MKNNRPIWHAGCMMMLLFMLTSCLKKDLPEYPLWDKNEIDNVYVEHRFESDQVYNGKPVVAYQRLNIASKTVDAATNTINIVLTVPAANGSFTDAERAKVSINKLWVYFDISTAATMQGTGGTPRPGDPANASKPLTYEVTAANGQKKTWTVNLSL